MAEVQTHHRDRQRRPVRLDERRERVVVEQFQPTAAAHSDHAPTRVCPGRDEVRDQALAPLLLEVKVPAVVPARAQAPDGIREKSRSFSRSSSRTLVVACLRPPSPGSGSYETTTAGTRGEARVSSCSTNRPTERARLEGVCVGVEWSPRPEALFAARVVVGRRAKQVLLASSAFARRRLSDRDRVGGGLVAAACGVVGGGRDAVRRRAVLGRGVRGRTTRRETKRGQIKKCFIGRDTRKSGREASGGAGTCDPAAPHKFRRAVTMAPRSFARWLLALAALFCVASTASAAVLGIDYGSEYVKVSIVAPGRTPISIVINEISKRKSTAAVAFTGGDRWLAEEAMNWHNCLRLHAAAGLARQGNRGRRLHAVPGQSTSCRSR